jgi:diphosphomevalonate decarboxylase
MNETRTARARAGTNIALVKYWGKRDADLNLPATGSLSLTLAELGTTTEVRFLTERAAGDAANAANAANDRVLVDGRLAEAGFSRRVSRFLDLVRAQAGLRATAEVSTVNSVPTAAGLASSASGFAALALAASRAAGLQLSPAQLSALARQGSGSAARSIFGGFVEMAAGERPDGSDAVAHPLPQAADWPLRLVVAVTATGPKAIGSTAAMERTAASSPYYPAWLASVPGDLAEARAALAARDLPRLGAVVERSALRMHASAMAAEPPILYWSPVTLAVMQALLRARQDSALQAYFTMDAGPHVKVLCRADDAPAVAAVVAAVPGVLRTIVGSPGPGAQLVLDAGELGPRP